MGIKNFDFLDEQNLLLIVVLTITFISFLIQLYYYIFVFHKVCSKRGQHFPEQIKEPVSVIICVKNEENNLAEILPLVLEQNYPEYEVIVVNDNSNDDSEDVLIMAKSQHPHLQIRNLFADSNSIHGKSVVLGVGIKAAKYERLVLTDVNCRPSPDWLDSISSGFNSDIVISYTRHKGNIFDKIANYFDSLFRIGYAFNRKPYSSTGENSSFRKELFTGKRFNPLLRKPEKVEQVFFNSIMNKKNTSVVLLPDAINVSKRYLPFFDWCSESSKSLFSTRLFRKGTRHTRLPEIISRTLFYTAIPLAIYLSMNILWLWISVGGLFLLRLIIQIVIFHKTQKIMGEKRLVLHTVLWDFYSIIVYIYIYMSFKQRKAIKYQ
jgi:cellulose synthase/poly-beta-1,6-N-acetylglucosamine synthase-like glycosyltransferase